MMCDTLVATPDVTADGVMLFAKNSDREPNEAQYLAAVPSQDYPAGSKLRMTYIEIPQVARTHAMLLAKPFWMWGAEMGVNEHGVAIGNEAVFTKIPYVKGASMTGMDLLRLGLERGATADEALHVMIDLLGVNGQGGDCGFEHTFYYHNSYIIADPQNAWVFETAGPHWAAKRIHGIYTISNGLTIGSEWDLASPELVGNAVKHGWCKDSNDFHFARCYSDFLYTRFSACSSRRQRSTILLDDAKGKLSIPDLMAALRDHGETGTRPWRPDRGVTGATVCMHAGFGPVRGSQTVGSIVSHLDPVHQTHFVTGTAAPCTSLFKPVWLDAGLPDIGPEPNGKFDPSTMFWRHEQIHRLTLIDYPERIKLYQSQRDELEAEFVAKALKSAGCAPAEKAEIPAHCFQLAKEAEVDWLEQLVLEQDKRPAGHKKNYLLYNLAWSGFNRRGTFSHFGN
jgi:secernin